MQRCNNIYNHPLYKERTAYITEREQDRIFCPHNLAHALDVARIGYIMILEENLNIDKELFYAAALLHDEGRYSDKPHNESGAELARSVMPDCGFTTDETELVSNAISGHRINSQPDDFSRNLYEADKRSRICFLCFAQKECYWDAEKRNKEITI